MLTFPTYKISDFSIFKHLIISNGKTARFKPQVLEQQAAVQEQSALMWFAGTSRVTGFAALAARNHK